MLSAVKNEDYCSAALKASESAARGLLFRQIGIYSTESGSYI